MCEKAVEYERETLRYIQDHFKTAEICKKAVRREPYSLAYVPDHFKAQKNV